MTKTSIIYLSSLLDDKDILRLRFLPSSVPSWDTEMAYNVSNDDKGKETVFNALKDDIYKRERYQQVPPECRDEVEYFTKIFRWRDGYAATIKESIFPLERFYEDGEPISLVKRVVGRSEHEVLQLAASAIHVRIFSDIRPKPLNANLQPA